MAIGSSSWSGIVKEKSVAKSEYTSAVDEGIQSSLLEKISATDYSVSVGPVEPSQSVEIRFSYLTRTEVQKDGSYRFVLPTNIAPKYNTSTSNVADMEYSAEMSAIPRAHNPGYSFEVDMKWSSGSVIQEVVSPTNGIRTSIISANSVRVQSTTTPANGDFTLCLKTESTTAAYSYDCPEDQSTYLYIHNRIPSEVTAAVPRKITILLDRSGSMGGSKINQALKAIESFLGLVDSSNYFNLVSFGSDHQALWSHPCLATEANKTECITALRKFSADMGGTELYHCLERVVCEDIQRFQVKQVPPSASDFKDLEHIVVLLTDGQVGNVEQINAMLQSKAQHCRVMTIGIGADADRKLVQRVAETTYGISRMLVDALDLTGALTDIIDYIHKQYYVNVRVDRYEAV
eukprot:gene34638-42726_t